MARDANDLGVPMEPGADHQGPEDALDPNARGDYSDRLGEGRSVEIVPADNVRTHDGRHQHGGTKPVSEQREQIPGR